MAIQEATLAAELFTDVPALRAEAEGIDVTQAIEKHGRTVKIDGVTYYVLEGDLLFDADEIRLYGLQQEAKRKVAAVADAAASVGVAPPAPASSAAALAINTAGGKVVRWKQGTVLRYTVNRKSFPNQAEYDRVVECMAAATQEWMDTCGVVFEHVVAHDGHPDPSTPANEIDPGLVFRVRKVDAQGEFIAAAFFPSYPPARRVVEIDPSFFAAGLSFDQVGVLRHELGHTLGFRHEHVRAEAPPSCPDEPLHDVFGITPYDPTSVMHYFCGGSGSNSLSITDTDRVGAQQIYGLPLASVHFVE